MKKNPFTQFDPRECGILADALQKGKEKATKLGVIIEDTWSYFYREFNNEGYYCCAIGYAGLSLCETLEETYEYFHISHSHVLHPTNQVAKDLGISAKLCHIVDDSHSIGETYCNRDAIIKLLHEVAVGTAKPTAQQ